MSGIRDWFATHETLNDFAHPEAVMPKKLAETLAGEPAPKGGWTVDPLGMLKFEAKWRAALRYLRADAMIAAGGTK